ncbi:MAG: MetS family NSS transporter small subunit [Cyclobacteriaceae bacterium]
MTYSAIISMIIILGFTFGGFLYFIILAIRNNK